jgi:transketolase
MRAHLFAALAEAAARQPPIWFLTGDLGFGQVDSLREALGPRYLNVGVAEQNLISVASGLALAGQRVVTYSIGPFGLLRAADQLRSGIVAHNLDVTVVCGGGGLSYGTLGFSHFALEDIALARALGVTVLTPTTQAELVHITELVLYGAGPQYLRLERECCEGPIISLSDDNERRHLRPMVVGYGAVMAEAVTAKERLRERGIDIDLLSVPVIDEFTSERLTQAIAAAPFVVTVEEHARHGGIGSLVADLIASNGLECRLRALATGPSVRHAWGSTRHLRQLQQLSAGSIYDTITSLADRE